jgi:hypothetical protein
MLEYSEHSEGTRLGIWRIGAKSLQSAQLTQAMIKLAQIFAKECSLTATLNQDFIYKYYEHFLPMLKKLSKLRSTYDNDFSEGFNRLIFRERISSAEALSCTHQFAKQHLSTKDSIRQLIIMYNIKIDFLSQFGTFVQLKSYEHLLVNKPKTTNKHRVKRHFLTHPLSVLTGLADADTVKKLAEQNNKVITAEEMDAEQIVVLENRTNSILDSLQMQSSKIGTLYKDEDKLEKELNLLLHDEQNLTRHLSVIVSSLEVLTDTQLEYGSVTFLLNSIEVMILDLEIQVNSILAQEVNAFMIPSSTIDSISVHSLGAAKLSGRIAADGYSVLIKIISFADVFSRKFVRVLPVPLQRDMWGQLLVEQPIIAINSRGEYFYDLGLCNTASSVTICEPELLNIRLSPDACVAELVLNKGLGNLCLNSMRIVSPVRQEYIYLKNGDEVVIFTPINDTLTFKCGIANIPETKKLAMGLNRLVIPRGCYARTSELVIHSHSMVMDRGLLPSVDNLDFSKDVEELSGLIESVHNLNFTKVIEELRDLGEDVSVDLASVDESLVEFRKIKALTGYHPMNISLTDPLSLTNVTNYSGATATLLMFIFVCYMCYKCATCCTPVLGLFKCVFEGIFGLFKKIMTLCGKLKVAKDDIEMTTDRNDDFQQKVAPSSGHIVWELEMVGQRLVLYAELQSGNIYYNSELNVVENQDGYILKGILPPIDVVNLYWQRFDKLEPPQVKRNVAEGLDYVLEQENVFFNNDSHKYVHGVTGKIIHGYKPIS